MIEEWRVVGEFKDYLVSDIGRVKSFKGGDTKGKILSGSKNSKYSVVGLYNEKGTRTCTIHRVVAKAFIPNPDNKPCINHKDGDKHNNHITNLEWCTHSENGKHAVRTGLFKPKNVGGFGKDSTVAKAGKIRMPDGSLLIYKCQNDLVREFGLSQGNLSSLLNGNRNYCKGWTRA